MSQPLVMSELVRNGGLRLLLCLCVAFMGLSKHTFVDSWIPFAEHAMMNGGNAMSPGHAGGGVPNPFANPGGGAGGADFGSFANAFMPAYHNLNSFRSSGSMGSICYCDIRINKLGVPGDLLFKLHYPTINADTCQAAILQCSTACRAQAQRQLTGNVLFEEGGLENVAPEKDVTVGTVLCKEHGKLISPPGVVASVFAKPDACGRATPIYDLTGEESRLCCTLIAHPYIRTEHILVFSPECIAGVAPPAPAGAAAGKGAAKGAAAPVDPAAAAPVDPAAASPVPAQAPEPVPFNQMPQMPPQFRHYDPMNAMMMNAFG